MQLWGQTESIQTNDERREGGRGVEWRHIKHTCCVLTGVVLYFPSCSFHSVQSDLSSLGKQNLKFHSKSFSSCDRLSQNHTIQIQSEWRLHMQMEGQITFAHHGMTLALMTVSVTDIFRLTPRSNKKLICCSNMCDCIYPLCMICNNVR